MNMTPSVPGSLPEPHRKFLASAIPILQHDPRIAGVAAGGSYVGDAMDEFSDLDLIIAFEPVHEESLTGERRQIASSLGPLLAAFTGEHLGEPRLLICLYDEAPPLHVDLKFAPLPDLARRVEDPAVLWERRGELTRAMAASSAKYPAPDLQWIEDRFWVWVHYTASKIGRGELFEALACLAYLRSNVLGPLALLGSGARPAGVRRLEQLAPEYARGMRPTAAGYSAIECSRALRACSDLYRALRSAAPPGELRKEAERKVLQYLTDVEAGIS